jgi:hypothetical protein
MYVICITQSESLEDVRNKITRMCATVTREIFQYSCVTSLQFKISHSLVGRTRSIPKLSDVLSNNQVLGFAIVPEIT